MRRKFVLTRGKSPDDNRVAEAAAQLLEDGGLGTVKRQDRGTNQKPTLREEGESTVLAEGKEEIERHVQQLLGPISASALLAELALI